MKNNARTSYLDLQLAQEVYGNRLRMLVESEAYPVVPGRMQSRQYSLFWDQLAIAQYQYALGYPIEKSRASIVAALAAYRVVTELRGTETVEHKQFKAVRNAVTGEFDVSQVLAEVQVDYSVGNSTDTFRAACLALTVDDWGVAKYLAENIYDPVGAGYVGSRSRIEVTLDHQRLSYAFRDYMAGASDSADDRLSVLFNGGCRIKYLQCEARVLRRILERDKEGFLSALAELLAVHAGETKKRRTSGIPA